MADQNGRSNISTPVFHVHSFTLSVRGLLVHLVRWSAVEGLAELHKQPELVSWGDNIYKGASEAVCNLSIALLYSLQRGEDCALQLTGVAKHPGPIYMIMCMLSFS